MKSRRGSLWGGGNENMVGQYKAGDLVRPVIVKNPGFIGTVRDVDARINKVWVAWGGGAVSQHDPDEVQLVVSTQEESVKARMASRRASADFFGGRTAKEKRIDVLRRIVKEQSYEKIDGHIVDMTTANMLVTVYDALEKKGEDMSKFDRVPLRNLVDLGWKSVRSASEKKASEGLDFFGDRASDRLMAHSASGRGRQAVYWCAPERTYRLTRGEQENGKAVCPRCKKDMALEPFTRSDKLWTCGECGFKVPRSKTTTTRVTIDVNKDTGEVDVDVTTANGRRGSR